VMVLAAGCADGAGAAVRAALSFDDEANPFVGGGGGGREQPGMSELAASRVALLVLVVLLPLLAVSLLLVTLIDREAPRAAGREPRRTTLSLAMRFDATDTVRGISWVVLRLMYIGLRADDRMRPPARASVPARPPDEGPGPSPWSKDYVSPTASAVTPAGMTPQLKAGRNVVLGDPNLPEELRPHRVALCDTLARACIALCVRAAVSARRCCSARRCEWPADQGRHNGEPRTSSPRILFRWLKKNGYDGMECTAPFMAAKFFAGMPMDDVAVSGLASQRPLMPCACARP
jgi:hypothetical protein